MSKGRHAKPSNLRRFGIASAVIAGGVVVPATFAGPSASAATQDQWDEVAQCEAGGDWTIDHSGDGLSVGGLQFQNPSWQDALSELRAQGVDTSDYPGELYQGMPNVPTREQQIMAGEALLKLQGPGAWVCNGYSALGSSSNSMFLGGPNPGVDGVPDVPAPEPTGTPAPATSGTHKVVLGDTLYGISIANGLGDGGLDTWRPLYDANKDVVGADPDLIYPGQVLTFPAAGTEAPADPAPVTPASGDYAAPIDAPVTQAYGVPGNYGTGYHTGVDFTAPQGTPVQAVHSGTVIIGGAGAPYGNHVVLDLGDGNYVLYGHLSEIDVTAGQSVSAGDLIGKVGATGNASGPHLHFELRNSPDQYGDGVFSDPVAWLESHGVIIF